MTRAEASRRPLVLGVILVAQTIASIGPLGIPGIASLIRVDLGLTLTQAGSFLSAYYVGPSSCRCRRGRWPTAGASSASSCSGRSSSRSGLVALSTSGSYGALMALTALAGCGDGMLDPASTQAVIAWSPPRHRASMVGIKQVGLPFGGMLGAVLLPALAIPLGWRMAVVVAAVPVALGAAASLAIYRDPPGDRLPPPAPGARGSFAEALAMRDVWLVSIATLVFAAMQTIWMSFMVLYLQSVVWSSPAAGPRAARSPSRPSAPARRRSDSFRSRSSSASSASAGTACSSPCWPSWPAAAAGTALGLGLAVSSLGVTLGPPIVGSFVTTSGSFRLPWLALSLTMLGALALLAPVRERGAGR